jgi:UDP-N-acetylmuramate--alanine ligase
MKEFIRKDASVLWKQFLPLRNLLKIMESSQLNEIKKAKKVYFIGIGGIGVSAIARLCLNMGKKVAGSDMRESETVKALVVLGAKISIGHDAKNIREFLPDVLVYTEDISTNSPGHVEMREGLSLHIPAVTYAQALGMLMEGKYSVGVTGTNGKSTTSAILALIMDAAGYDPSVVIGSKISPRNQNSKFFANARLGESKYFVAEADEYHRHMMEHRPSMAVLTNVAEDHLDYYKDIFDIKNAFKDYIATLPANGMVIYNADDHNAVEVGRIALCHKFTFGIKHYADLQAVNIKTEAGVQTFDVHLNDKHLGNVKLNVPGEFNVLNALGAMLAAFKLGIGFDVIKSSVESFAGIWRRFERVGYLGKAEVVSDYAHHPAGVAGTIKAAKEFYPNGKILFVFQPHHRNRTRRLFSEFVDSLSSADDVVIPEIFDVAGREHGEDVSSQQIVNELNLRQVRAVFAKDLEETETIVKQMAHEFKAIIMMGAGDIDLLARKLIK